MNTFEIIKSKRDGHALSRREVEFFVENYVSGAIADYQMSALLMAIYFQGLNDEETNYLTSAYLDSGKTLEFSALEGVKIDKHSTGGVGDKVSLILAPLVASLGAVYIPMISGRGLGHTGGTLDKLETIPGFRTDLSIAQFKHQVGELGCAITSQSAELTPADGKIYALRDVTATVACIPLIVASIMSKKLAEGIDSLMLDVKSGNGAFMQDDTQAEQLAKALIKVGKAHGCETRAIITDMNQPLGRTVGNALEVKESIEFLRAEKQADDLKAVVFHLAAHMLLLAKRFDDFNSAYHAAESAVSSGKALDKFRALIAAQNGDPKVCDDLSLLVDAKYKFECKAERSGYISRIDTMGVGLLAVEIGAGRENLGDAIDPAVGLEFFKKIGNRVETGDTIALIHLPDNEKDT